MAAFRMDMATRSNEDWVDAIALWLPDESGNPTTEPFPISNAWTIVQHLRQPNEMLAEAFINSSANGRLMIVVAEDPPGTPTEVRIQWNVTREVIEHLPAGLYFHDVKLIDPDGGELVLFAGTVTHTLGTTRP